MGFQRIIFEHFSATVAFDDRNRWRMCYKSFLKIDPKQLINSCSSLFYLCNKALEKEIVQVVIKVDI